MSGFFSNFLKKIGLQSNKKEIERTTDKIELTQNKSKTSQKAEPTEFIQPSHTRNTIETTKLEKFHTRPADAKDRVVRVFVSSTFKDMIEDRNELMSRVWPALRKICRGRAVEFVDVDLRWGITEKQSQRKETLRHCLAEIKRCRPYFIGLLGERYGQVPGEEKYSPALLDEESWLRSHVAKRSVTELEIIHGVLNDPDLARRAFFYFRDPKYAQDRGGDFITKNDADADRLSALKEQVRSVCEAKHIPLREELSRSAGTCRAHACRPHWRH